MLREVFPDRWFIWTIVIITTVGVGVWYKIQMDIMEIDQEIMEALAAAPAVQGKAPVSTFDTSN